MGKIKDKFMQKTFLETLEDIQLYINIKKSRMHKVTCRFSFIPYAEMIGWIITDMDESHLVRRSESGI